jgi:Transposase protein
MQAGCVRLKKDPSAAGGGLRAAPSTKSQRSVVDEGAPLGVATTRSMERVAAAVGLLREAPIEFEPVADVPLGGVLCALPALLGFGLLRHTRENFTLPPGFYPIETIFLVVAFLALARIRSLEALRYQAPGEWGKLLGLDRVPEVKTLREKLGILCADPERARAWSSTLARDWMEATPESAGTLYIDGHVRVYHGALTRLPRRYVSRERLCLRGTTDYWVNAMDGQPFFVVTRPVDDGLLSVLKEEIVPRLQTEVPGQPGAEELAADPLQHRFTIVFDREGYSPKFFAAMREKRIAVLTYHKFPGADWGLEEFSARSVRLVNAEEVTLQLAERGVRLSNGLWVREVRHRDARGHQTAILSTDYHSDLTRVAAAMFARWCQENFFKYMQQHYAIDRLLEYGIEPIPDSTRVVNPAWRSLDSQVRSQQSMLVGEQARFGALQLPVEATAQETAAYETKKGQLLQSIESRQLKLAELKAQRKNAPKHVLLKDLPQEDRFTRLAAARKHLVDTVKLVAYRAETALVAIARESLSRPDDARALVRQLLTSSVDLQPDLDAKTLNVRLHRLSTAAHDAVLVHLCEELTATETLFPGTELRLVFTPLGPA